MRCVGSNPRQTAGLRYYLLDLFGGVFLVSKCSSADVDAQVFRFRVLKLRLPLRYVRPLTINKAAPLLYNFIQTVTLICGIR